MEKYYSVPIQLQVLHFRNALRILLPVRNRTRKLLLTPVRVALFLLLTSAAGRAGTIFLQPVIVGSASDHTASDLTFADAIFAQMSLSFVMLPELTSSTLPTTMDGNNPWVFLADSTWQAGPVLTVWYVPTISSSSGTTRGISFGGSVGSTVRYGVAVADASVADTLAHEVGHVLLDFQCGTNCYPGDPAHAADPDNLMAPGSIRQIPTSTSDVYGQGGIYDQLTASQISVILQDDTGFLDTPEPATAALFFSGTAFLLLFRRVRR